MSASSSPEAERAADLAALERTVYGHIPLARAMGVRVLRSDADGVLLVAPLAPNINHRQTFFGGSAAALATLAAWVLAQQRLLEEEGLDGHLVIQRSSMEYLEPAAAEVLAECRAPDSAAWARLIRMVKRHGKGRIELTVELTAEGCVVGSFTGSFVVFTE